MEVIFYSEFSKRKNSTKNPESAGAISVSVTKQVTLKNMCSKLKPSFFVADTTGYVYCKAWGWYYFVTNEGYDINGAHYVDCEIDPLGTWKVLILAHSAFVRYSTLAYSDRIPDTRLSTLTGVSIVNYNNLFGEIYGNEDQYRFYLSVLGDNGIDDWLLTPNELITVIHELIQEGSNIFGSLTTQFTDAISCLLKCRIVPLSENAFAGSREGDTVHLGEWDTGVAGFHMTRTWGSTQDFVSVTHPNDFRIIEPYSYCKVTLPFAGTFDFSLDELYGTNILYFSCAYNASTGKIAYKLFRDNIDAGAGESKILAQFNGEFGMDVPVGAQEMSNPAGTIGAVASLASAILAPNPVSASGAIAGAKQAFMGMQKTTSMVGGYGGNGGWHMDRRLKVEVFSKALSDNPENMALLYGRPLDAVHDLASLEGGYVQTEGFHINASIPDIARDMIDKAMDSGVYLE